MNLPYSSHNPLKVLISQCLTGVPCNYKGQSHYQKIVETLKKCPKIELFPFCPESVILPTPREPANIMGHTGAEVLVGKTQVQTHSGTNISKEFIQGAEAMLKYAQKHNVKMAFLKERSPSCAVQYIYNGQSWPKKILIPGMGVAAQLLSNHNITVISDEAKEVLCSFLTEKNILVSLP